MKYAITLNNYGDYLEEKYMAGLLSEDKFYRLVAKLVEWETVARKKRMK